MSAGKRVSAGRLRVDAARAVDKLRDFQLPDPRLWVLEVVRAAVAQGATRVEVTGDADDVRVAWHGPPMDRGAIARLFDELVDPAPRPAQRPLRLLATGVNTALGLEPRWLDVVTIDGAAAARVRYSTRLLEKTADGAADRLRDLAAEEILPPPGAPPRGGLVHLRRLPEWDAVPLLIGYGEPRELSVVRRSADDLAVPLHVGRSALGRQTSSRDLLRVSLGEPLDGFLALVDPAAVDAYSRLEVAELGVVLARYELPLGTRAPAPLRVFVTAPRMPTNASRSGVRLDEPPVRDAIERGRALLGDLVTRLASELGDDGEHAWTPTQRERLRAAALALLAAHCAGEAWRARLQVDDPSDPLPAWLAPLLEVPLVRDALGRERTLSSFSAYASEERVHYGDDPLGPELEPWLGDSLWVPPSDPARVLLGDWQGEPAAALAKRARKYTQAREAFWATKPRAPALPDGARGWLKVTLDAPGRSLKSLVDGAPFEVPGLAGELALGHVVGSRLDVLVEGRVIERLELDREVGFSAVATCDGLTPRYDFRAARRDERLFALVDAVEAATVVAAEALALRCVDDQGKPGDRATLLVPTLTEAPPEAQARVREVLRRALAFAFGWVRARVDGDVEQARALLRASRSPLLSAPIWRGARGDAVSTRALLRAATLRPVGFTRQPPMWAEVPTEPVVVVVGPRDEALLRELIGDDALLDYGQVLRRLPKRPRLADAGAAGVRTGGVWLDVQGSGVRASVAWGVREGRLEVFHWGQRVHSEALSGEPPMLVRVSDPGAIPDARFRAVRNPDALVYPIERWGRQLARTYIDVLTGAQEPEALIAPEDPAEATAALRALMVAIGERRDLKGWMGKARLRALCRVPLFSVLGREERASVAELRAAEGDIPFLPREAASAAPPGFHPALCDPVERAALEALSGRGLLDVSGQLASLMREAERDLALARHRARPPHGATFGWVGPSVEVPGKGFRSAAASFGPLIGAEVAVLVEGRLFKHHHDAGALPVRAYVDLDESCVDRDFEDLTDVGRRRVRYVIRAGARALLEQALRDDPRGLLEAHVRWRLLSSWAESLDPARLTKRARRILDALAEARMFESVQGETISLRDAAKNRTLRVARWDGQWLARRDPEPVTALDDGVVALPRDEGRRATLRELLRVAWPNRVEDVTAGVERLQTARRVARGLTEVPRLETVADARFRYSLDDVLAKDPKALEILGVGEVALARGERTVVTLASDGGASRRVELNLIPRIEVAALSGLSRGGGALQKAQRAKLEEAVTTLTARVLRRVIDSTPAEELPRWVRDALRASCLAGGPDYLDRLPSTPIFLTTSGAWVSPEAVREDAARWGELWTTPREDAGVPYDDRLAVVLSRSEREQLADWIHAADATEELALDATKRANLSRAPRTSLEPSPEVLAAAATIVRIEPSDDDPLEGTIAVLKPGYAPLRGLRLSRARHPLGDLPDPARWPAAATLDHPGLVPDRTWSGPEHDATWLAIQGRVRREVWRALAQLVPGVRARYQSRVRPSGPDARTVEGSAHLTPDGSPGACVVVDPYGQRRVATVGGLPLSATLWFARPVDADVLEALCRAVYKRLVKRVVERLLGDPTAASDLVFLLSAIRHGAPPEAARLAEIEVPPTHPTLTVAELLAGLRARQRYAVCGPDEVEEASTLELPLLIDDGTPVSAELLRVMASRAAHFRDLLAVSVLGEDEAHHPRTARTDVAPAEPGGRSTLEAAIHRALPVLAIGGVSAVRVVEGRRRPICRVARNDRLVFAGDHPAVAASRAAVEAGAPEADALVSLLLMRAAGCMQRRHGRLGAPGQLEVMIGLLSRVGPAD